MKNLIASHSKKFWIITIFISFLIIILSTIALVSINKKNKDYLSPVNGNLANTNNLNQEIIFSDCGNSKELLKTSPVALNDLSTIIPMGNFAPPGHIGPTGHMYYNYLNIGTPTNPIPAKTNILSPADMTITQITMFDNASAVHPFNSYRIDFTICKQLSGYFIHVVNLSDRLNSFMKEPWDHVQKSEIGGTKAEHTYAKTINQKVKASEVIGFSGGDNSSPFGLDFGLIDSRSAVPVLANPNRWKYDSHYVCSLDYYPLDLSKELYKHLGNYSFKYLDENSGEPKCGTVYQDVPGSAQGVWFTKDVPIDTLGDPAQEITLGHNNFFQKQEVFSLGNKLNSIGINTDAAYIFTPSSSGKVNLDFSKVKEDGNVYCYELKPSFSDTAPKIILGLQLINDQTLHLGKISSIQCGLGPWTLNNFVEYIR